MNHNESEHQQALFAWSKLMQPQLPELALLHATGNGNGKRNIIQGARMKREGVLAGVSDIMLPVARGGYHGLYIELKTVKGGRVSLPQQWWLEETAKQGYRSVVCHGWVEAKEVIEGYLRETLR